VARQAYAGFANGDVTAVLNLVDENLEWTFLDPSVPDPQPAVCRGRDQLACWMEQGSGWKLRAELEEVVADGDRVLVVTHSPGIDAIRAHKTGNLTSTCSRCATRKSSPFVPVEVATKPSGLWRLRPLIPVRA